MPIPLTASPLSKGLHCLLDHEEQDEDDENEDDDLPF
jgi:hypothetical protein